MHRSKRATAKDDRAAFRGNGVAKALAEVAALDQRLGTFERSRASLLARIDPARRPSARNLLHYIALRSADIRDLQDELAALGLSSLGRSEAHAQATVQAVRSVLRSLVGRSVAAAVPLTGPTFTAGRRLLAANSDALLGPVPAHRDVRIMVTMPSEAADDPHVVEELLFAGMDVMRINCAHDDEALWAKMIQHLARAKKKLGRTCKVLMDLAGPKVRTGPIAKGPGVVHWRPTRDVCGRPIAPARIWLHADARAAKSEADANVPVSRAWLARLRPGSQIDFWDVRRRRRSSRVVAVEPAGAWAEGFESCYLEEGIELVATAPGGKRGFSCRVRALQPVEQAIPLARGDTLLVTRASVLGRPAVRDTAGTVLEPARIGCTLAEVFTSAGPNQRIWFDDGKIGGIIRRVDSDSLAVEITQTAKAVARLGADKGINLPDTSLAVSGLTEKDLVDLAFVVRHADGVSMSFVRSPDDVVRLEAALTRHRARRGFGVVYKIETRGGFENLPEILLTAMTGRPIGVMIARGDLAIECGYERLAELQEEILWISEAAHVPAIWATQVLETMAKKGMPSRAEITDAAMGERAECVMLNKGPHVVEAVRALDDILRRMQGHQQKKSPRLRMLRLAKVLSRSKPTVTA
jgi:pyruvate kinase